MAKKSVGLFKKLSGKILGFIKKIKHYVIIFAAIYILLGIIVAFLTLTDFKKLKGTCIEALDFGGRSGNIVPALPTLVLNGNYSHEELREKAATTSFNFRTNGDPIALNIKSQWIPWFGDEYVNTDANRTQMAMSTPDRNFLCFMKRVELKGDNRFSQNKDENTYYYIGNVYRDLPFKNGKLISASERRRDTERGEYNYLWPPEYQEACWINRGMGLYMGFYEIGEGGSSREPEQFHHVLATKGVCQSSRWFNGNTNNMKVSANGKKYNYDDFLEEYFTVSYFLKRDRDYYKSYCAEAKNKQKCGDIFKNDPSYSGGTSELLSTINSYYDNAIKKAEVEEKDIMQSGSFIYYDIQLHEDLLYMYKVRNPEVIISYAITKFMQGCYYKELKITTDSEGQKSFEWVLKYDAKFRFGPTVLYKSYAADSANNIRYEPGAELRFFIADNYYSDNQGDYEIEILSGITQRDTAGPIESFIRDMEFFLLGTPSNDPAKDRADGMISKMFNNFIFDTGFNNIVRVVLALYIVVLGYRMIMGLGSVKTSELMMFAVKMSFLFAILDRDGWQFFNRIVVGTFVDGAIGGVQLIMKVFYSFFSNNGDITNTAFMAGGITADPFASDTLSSNFRIIDNLIDLLIFRKELWYKIWSFGLNSVGVGLFFTVLMVIVIVMYLQELMHIVVPFMVVLIQIAIVVPLCPVFMLFGFFKLTEEYFKKWLGFVASRSFELLSFFLGFYFVTTIVGQQLENVLGFEICFKSLYDILVEDAGGSGLINFATKLFKWLLELIVIPQITSGLDAKKTLIEILFLLLSVKMFRSTVDKLMEVFNSMFSFNGGGIVGSSVQGNLMDVDYTNKLLDSMSGGLGINDIAQQYTNASVAGGDGKRVDKYADKPNWDKKKKQEGKGNQRSLRLRNPDENYKTKGIMDSLTSLRTGLRHMSDNLDDVWNKFGALSTKRNARTASNWANRLIEEAEQTGWMDAAKNTFNAMGDSSAKDREQEKAWKINGDKNAKEKRRKEYGNSSSETGRRMDRNIIGSLDIMQDMLTQHNGLNRDQLARLRRHHDSVNDDIYRAIRAKLLADARDKDRSRLVRDLAGFNYDADNEKMAAKARARLAQALAMGTNDDDMSDSTKELVDRVLKNASNGEGISQEDTDSLVKILTRKGAFGEDTPVIQDMPGTDMETLLNMCDTSDFFIASGEDMFSMGTNASSFVPGVEDFEGTTDEKALNEQRQKSKQKYFECKIKKMDLSTEVFGLEEKMKSLGASEEDRKEYNRLKKEVEEKRKELKRISREAKEAKDTMEAKEVKN